MRRKPCRFAKSEIALARCRPFAAEAQKPVDADSRCDRDRCRIAIGSSKTRRRLIEDPSKRAWIQAAALDFDRSRRLSKRVLQAADGRGAGATGLRCHRPCPLRVPLVDPRRSFQDLGAKPDLSFRSTNETLGPAVVLFGLGASGRSRVGSCLIAEPYRYPAASLYPRTTCRLGGKRRRHSNLELWTERAFVQPKGASFDGHENGHRPCLFERTLVALSPLSCYRASRRSFRMSHAACDHSPRSLSDRARVARRSVHPR